ncbi:MAG: hypothetical protein OEO82_01900 [Gammaproteobacteria bacterium]|nr:hypothetical protein [Gammaproteobacteria bacterium]
MPELRRIPLQVIAYTVFAVGVGYFATLPHYGYGDPELATIKVSLSHAANRAKPCIKMTAEEIAELAANMRRTETCERQRLPLILELDIDNEPVLRLHVPPSGLWGDGPASIYERFDVAPGAHLFAVRLRDTARTEGWDYARTDEVFLAAGRYFTVTFEAETGGFIFR